MGSRRGESRVKGERMSEQAEVSRRAVLSCGAGMAGAAVFAMAGCDTSQRPHSNVSASGALNELPIAGPGSATPGSSSITAGVATDSRASGPGVARSTSAHRGAPAQVTSQASTAPAAAHPKQVNSAPRASHSSVAPEAPSTHPRSTPAPSTHPRSTPARSTPAPSTPAPSTRPRSTPAPSHSSAPPARALAKLSAIPIGGSIAVDLAGRPITVAQPSAGNVVAFSAICTHAGCTVNPGGAQLNCPCHGSVFSAFTGQVVQGPAPLPLPQVPVHVTDGYVVSG